MRGDDPLEGEVDADDDDEDDDEGIVEEEEGAGDDRAQAVTETERVMWASVGQYFIELLMVFYKFETLLILIHGATVAYLGEMKIRFRKKKRERAHLELFDNLWKMCLVA